MSDKAPEAVIEDAPITGLTLVRSEFNGEHGAEHHWFEVPKGEKPEKYQAEIDAFIASRHGLAADDITVNVAG